MSDPLFSADPDRERLAGAARSTVDRLGDVLGASPGRVNRRLVKALGDHGLLPALFPKDAGGDREGGVSAVDLCVLREALAMGSTEAETALALQGLGAFPILQAGSRDLIEWYVAPAARGEAVAAFALTEPEHGSDAGALELQAVPVGDGWRLSGTKTWISNAPDADVYTVFARTGDPGPRGVTAFVVPGGAEGLSGQPLDLLSDHPVGRLDFDDVPVRGDHVLGEPGKGFEVAMRTLDLYRPSVGAFAVGMARAALGLSVAHAAERRAFGKPIREFQAVSHLLAEMATRTEAARLLVYDAAHAYDDARPGVARSSAMAKLYATETAQWVVDSAVQIHGAAALERGHPLEHLYRDVRSPRIYEGTSQIQREVIARDLFRP